MIRPNIVIIYVILAAIVFWVQMIILKKTEKKVLHLTPWFVMTIILFVAYIMSIMDVKGVSVEKGSLMPIVRIIKDGYTVCIVADAAAMVINKLKK